jgi:hypothetical protein
VRGRPPLLAPLGDPFGFAEIQSSQTRQLPLPDAKTFGETICPEFLSITRKAIGGRRTHSAGIPAKAGIHAEKKRCYR